MSKAVSRRVGGKERDQARVSVAFASTAKRSIDISAHERRRVLISSIAQTTQLTRDCTLQGVRKYFTTISIRGDTDPLFSCNVSQHRTLRNLYIPASV